MWTKWFRTRKKAYRADHEAYKQLDSQKMPQHVAIIMDGNGRWAQRKGLPRTFGHHAGVKVLKKIVRLACDIKLPILTVYAFSTENWKRPMQEVEVLMSLFADFLNNDIDELHEKDVQIRFIGRVEELSPVLRTKMAEARQRTVNNKGLILNLAVNYGGRTEIMQAAQTLADKVKNGELSSADITEQVISDHLYTGGLPDPDLLIRPGGDCRISNFLLWQLAYTEIWLTDATWPEFSESQLLEAIEAFQKRERRFGGLNA